ncbi:primase-helicase family protein [Alloyangia pacifica]|uniref:Uncharacterized protein n=1 Tax=Alloyangia pacifica TaxID=311180 RepID=A0A1I6PR43_9RHOB|nr:primase-helicase family protein [Alloyangia pacifica]SDG33418.1 hypothetical protein SAMN04488245_102403 [Alloyangia pacifica]SFS42538.1 hypothetical protein SAMN04488050_101704 [Alloyangia pacifica]
MKFELTKDGLTTFTLLARCRGLVTSDDPNETVEMDLFAEYIRDNVYTEDRDALALAQFKMLELALWRFRIDLTASGSNEVAIDITRPSDKAGHLKGVGLARLLDGGTMRLGTFDFTEDGSIPRFPPRDGIDRNKPTAMPELWEQLSRGKEIMGTVHRFDLPVPIARLSGVGAVLNTVDVPDWVLMTGVRREEDPEFECSDDDATLFEAYLEALIPDDTDREYVVKWIGWKLKRPKAILPMVLFCSPEEGTGRGTLFGFLTALFGAGNVTGLGAEVFDPNHADSRFNLWRTENMVGFVHEISPSDGGEGISKRQVSARQQRQGLMRDIVDPGEDKIIRAADKNARAVKAPATCTIMAATNFPHALELPPTDRRVLVIDNTQVPDTLRKSLREAGGNWEFLAATAEFCMRRTWETAEEAYAEPHRNDATLRMMTSGISQIGSVEELFQRAVMPKEGEPVYLPGAVYVLPQLYAAAELVLRGLKLDGLDASTKNALRRLAVHHAPDHEKREKRHRDSPLLRDGFLADKLPDGGTRSMFEMWMSPHADLKIWGRIIGNGRGRRSKEDEQRLNEALKMNDAALLEQSRPRMKGDGKVIPLHDE